MNFRDTSNSFYVSASEQLEMAWWLIIATEQPHCTYYFGPFLNAAEAMLHKSGYVEDLVEEGAQGFSFVLRECYPNQLTIEEDSLLTSIKKFV